MMDYQEFLRSKKTYVDNVGIELQDDQLNPCMSGDFAFQAPVTKWMIKRGRAAGFMDCGFGKTVMQLEFSKHASIEQKGFSLILAPPAVCEQTSESIAPQFGYNCQRVYDQSEIDCAMKSPSEHNIFITNYQRIHLFDLESCAGLSLDEGDILANYTGKTKQEIIARSKGKRFKSVWTATPSPNNEMEIGNYAEFLEVMPSNEMLSRFFINDTMKSGGYRLKKHAEGKFWEWVSTWAICLTHPSQLGFKADGFKLPKLNIHKIVVSVDQTINRQDGELFRNVELSSTSIHKEMRLTAKDRAAKVAEYVNGNDDAWGVWCNTDYEADELNAVIPDAKEVRGSHNDDQKTERLNGFTKGDFRVIVTKPKIGGFGLNWQHCHKVAFVGLSYSFKDLYQALRRFYRYGQTKDVDAYLIMAETEVAIMENLEEKIRKFEVMQEEMSKAVMLHHEITETRLRSDWMESTAQGENFKIYNGDCVETIRKNVPDNSVNYSVFSPPFSNLYIYSDYIQDMGNCADHKEFFEHYQYLAKELFRVIVPGGLVTIHCKDLPLYQNRDGVRGLYDFPGDNIRLFEKEGFAFHSRVTIWKDPVIEMQRTKNHGLLYKELCKDSRGSRQGMADYMITMRKWPLDGGEAHKVTTGGERFARYVGEDSEVVVSNIAKAGKPSAMKLDESKSYDEYLAGFDDPDNYYPESFDCRGEPMTREEFHKNINRKASIEVWQRYASPVWFDIQQTDVLNVKQAREGKDEKHICPLQLGAIRRAIDLWTNPGDVVLSPFMGIGSEGYVSLQEGRRFIGCELKESYFAVALENLSSVAGGNELDLFGEQDL